MIRVGLARTAADYGGVVAPFAPGKAYPEIGRLLSDAASGNEPNPAYEGVRGALHALGLDSERFGSEAWNPLGELVARGGRVVLKPNFIRHWNARDGGHVSSVITHGAVLRAVADYAWIAVGPRGSVAIAEAPQHDCDFERIREIAGLDELAALYRNQLQQTLDVIDLRREAVVYRDGVIVERRTRAIASSISASGAGSTARVSTRNASAAPTTMQHRRSRTTAAGATPTCSRRRRSPPTSS